MDERLRVSRGGWCKGGDLRWAGGWGGGFLPGPWPDVSHMPGSKHQLSALLHAHVKKATSTSLLPPLLLLRAHLK